jgi:hypothetical protein
VTELTDEQLEQILGHRGWKEYRNAPDWDQPKIRDWASTLASMSDAAFVGDCSVRILNSASANRFEGNWDGDHARASACYEDAKRRYAAAGHVDCKGDHLYTAGYNRAFRSQGHTPRPWADCTCGVGNEKERALDRGW